MSINDDTTKPRLVHALRREISTDRRRQIAELEAELAELRRLEREAELARYRELELKELDKRVAYMRAERPAVYVEDIILGRLGMAEASLSVAVGLFKELAEDQLSPCLPYEGRLIEALEIIRDALDLRDREGRVWLVAQGSIVRVSGKRSQPNR